MFREALKCLMDRKLIRSINQVSNSFIPTDEFQGKKDGYVFKADDLGLGYYIDK